MTLAKNEYWVVVANGEPYRLELYTERGSAEEFAAQANLYRGANWQTVSVVKVRVELVQ